VSVPRRPVPGAWFSPQHPSPSPSFRAGQPCISPARGGPVPRIAQVLAGIGGMLSSTSANGDSSPLFARNFRRLSVVKELAGPAA
jgi:hypothetical protein